MTKQFDLCWRLIDQGNKLRPVLERFGPTCPCSLVYMAEGKLMPAEFLSESADMTGTNHLRKYRVSVLDLPSGDKECPICYQTFSVRDRPLKMPCCNNLIGESCFLASLTIDRKHRNCMLQYPENKNDCTRCCPFCRKDFLWYAVSSDKLDVTVIPKLIELYDSLPFEFSCFHPPSNAKVHVHSQILDIERFVGQPAAIAARSGSGLLFWASDQVAFIEAVGNVVNTFRGRTMRLEDLIAKIQHALGLSTFGSDQDISETAKSTFMFWLNMSRYLVLKYWIGCHVSQTLSDYNVVWNDRRASDFGPNPEDDGYYQLPVLPSPFREMPELQVLKHFDQDWQGIVSSSTPAQKERFDEAVRDLYDISNQLYVQEVEDEELTREDIARVITVLLRIQAVFSRLKEAVRPQ